MGSSIEVILIDSCLRDGVGGSPTAVVTNDGGLADADIARIPRLAGTSHVAVMRPPTAPGDSHAVRFFTSEGELPGCGHGTVAVIAVLSSVPGRLGWQGLLRAGGRNFDASGLRDPLSNVVEAWFDQGHVESRSADAGLVGPFLAALRLRVEDLHPADPPTVASPGKPRLLLPVANRDILGGLRPNHGQLVVESRRHGQLGCFVYTPSSSGQRPVARMFAPAIGVAEDVANANSTGCLAAHLLTLGCDSTVAVDQGDALGRPSTVFATAVRTPAGIATRVGGTARLIGTIQVPVG